MNVARAVIFRFHTLAIFCAAQSFPGGRKDHERCQSVISVAIALANVGWAISSVGWLFSTLQERYSNASSVGPGLNVCCMRRYNIITNGSCLCLFDIFQICSQITLYSFLPVKFSCLSLTTSCSIICEYVAQCIVPHFFNLRPHLLKSIVHVIRFITNRKFAFYCIN